MTELQKKALRFAYQLLSRAYKSDFLPYVSIGGWIEPDRAPDKPYLNEDNLMALVMLGYFECKAFMRADKVWLYRISREGCAVMGWEYPLRLIHTNGSRPSHLPPNHTRPKLPRPPRDTRPGHVKGALPRRWLNKRNG
jgi:hypothetical protein